MLRYLLGGLALIINLGGSSTPQALEYFGKARKRWNSRKGNQSHLDHKFFRHHAFSFISNCKLRELARKSGLMVREQIATVACILGAP